MRKQKKPSWLDWLAQVLKMTGVVTIVSFAVGWGGWRLRSCFSPPSVPTTKPPTTSATIDNREEEDKESDQDSTSTSLVTGSERTNRLEGTPENEGELKTLPALESDAEYEIRKREVLIREIELLISISNSKTAEIEPGWILRRNSKVGSDL